MMLFVIFGALLVCSASAQVVPVTTFPVAAPYNGLLELGNVLVNAFSNGLLPSNYLYAVLDYMDDFFTPEFFRSVFTPDFFNTVPFSFFERLVRVLPVDLVKLLLSPNYMGEYFPPTMLVKLRALVRV